MTLNIMTLGGIAASVGLVVDDAIVVIEQGVRRLRESHSGGRSSIFQAAREMLLPLTGSSLVTMVIFLPLAFLSGVTGAFFRPLSLTVALTLAVSYGFALLVVPAVTHALVRDRDIEQADFGPQFGRFLAAYERLLERWVRNPRAALITAGAVAGLGLLALTRLGTGFLPKLDEGGFVIDYRAPAGTSLSETDRRLHEVERILQIRRNRDLLAARPGWRSEASSPRRTRATSSCGCAAPRRGIADVIDGLRAHRARVPGSRSSCRSWSRT
jgi:multidrug efflux pump subunit AcrB